MTDAELRAKAEAATPGPLHLAEVGSWHTNTLVRAGSNWPHDDTDPVATEMSHEDAAYWIAASPDAVLALLDRVEAAEAAVERVRALAETWRYKGEFGWGAWQEGDGPDEEGWILDKAAGEIRTALDGADLRPPTEGRD